MCQQWAQPITGGDLVLIGGLSRSGKSTLAHCLQESLQQRGIRSHIVSLDGWLKEPEKRGPSVIERYDLDALNRLIETLDHQNVSCTLSIPRYSKRELQSKWAEELTIASNEVVILEGTIALSLNLAHVRAKVHHWHVDIDEAQRKERLLSEYRIRGRSPSEASAIYEQRQQDEAPYILASKKIASVIVDLQLSSDLS
jgi:uridine kinase